MSESASQPGASIDNNSEIVFFIDTQDNNPNGTPMGENRPRIDPVTSQCVITDVRLKRYLRDQLQEDGHPVYVKTTDDGAKVRAELALDMLGDIDSVEDLENLPNIEEEFLKNATDVRYFGAALTFNDNSEDELNQKIKEEFQTSYTGPVQFSPSRSVNAVELNEDSNKLTSVIATQEGKETGGYMLDDHRIKYGIFPFHGLIDAHGAEDTQLTQEDVERLDTLTWRAVKNQTITRSKVGTEPRFYARVEYATEGYYIGGLHNLVEIDEERSKRDSELRNVRDLTLDITDFVNSIARATTEGHVETVHVTGDRQLQVTYDGEEHNGSEIPSLLEYVGVPVHEIDVYEESDQTEVGA